MKRVVGRASLPAAFGGTAFPGCARLIRFLATGWKACATNLENFSQQSLMGLWLNRKL
jgi:hypothetical protein